MARVLISAANDPFDNLAAEELLFDGLSPGEEAIFLCANRPAVVWGRFQNPWKECRVGIARREGFALCRRISGGGTVVHDDGNLNISFMSTQPRLERENNLDRVIAAVAGLGITARRNERFDLLVATPEGEKKVSGSAYRKVKGRSLHHLTLLISADLARLKALLVPSGRDIRAKGTPSVSSPVANLSDIRPGLDVPEAIETLSQGFREGLSVGEAETVEPSRQFDEKAFLQKREEIASYGWVFGKTPPFTETFPNLGGLELTVEHGQIVTRRPESPHSAFILGLRYDGETIRTAGQGRGGSAARFAAALGSAVDGIDSPNQPIQNR